ncbi:hypothetical protein [Thiomonas sp.]
MTARWPRYLLLAQLAALLVLGGVLAWFGHPGLALLLVPLGLPAGYLPHTGLHVLAGRCARHEAPACPATALWRAWLVETGLQMRAFIWLQPWHEQAWPDWLGAALRFLESRSISVMQLAISSVVIIKFSRLKWANEAVQKPQVQPLAGA